MSEVPLYVINQLPYTWRLQGYLAHKKQPPPPMITNDPHATLFRERAFFIDNFLVRIHYIIVMIR